MKIEKTYKYKNEKNIFKLLRKMEKYKNTKNMFCFVSLILDAETRWFIVEKIIFNRCWIDQHSKVQFISFLYSHANCQICKTRNFANQGVNFECKS